MPSISIDQALSIGYNTLKPITNNYKNETLWLLQKSTQLNLQNIFFDTSHILQNADYNQFILFINRRFNREPLQYILGSISMCGYNFDIKKDVFIPRPETETFISILKKQTQHINTALEIGSGTGCIAIILELEHLAKKILSIDINNQAIKLAKHNAQKLKCINTEFFVNNIFYMEHPNKYDLIISNPPYIRLQDIELLEPEVILYDPLSALTDYEDGLTFYRYFAKHGKNLLNPKGVMLFEFGGHKQLNDIITIFTDEQYNYTIFNDLNGEPRFILVKF